MIQTAELYRTKPMKAWESIIEQWQTEAEWKEARKSGIGASEVAAIFGCGYANQSPLTIWASKTGTAEAPIDEATLRMFKRGHKLEPVIASEFEDETGLLAIDPGDYTIFRHLTVPFLFATLDRFCLHPEHGPIPVELKAVNGRFRGDWNEDEEPPLKYNIQCQVQMACTGASHCYLVGLVGGDELVIRLIERNDRFIETMYKRLEEFWGYVQLREMPPVDASEATRSMLGLIYPKDSGAEVSLPDDFIELDRELLEVKDKIKVLESRENIIENQIKAAIGEATRGCLPVGSYTWKLQSRTGIDMELLRERYPEIALECEKCSEFRVLRRSNK